MSLIKKSFKHRMTKRTTRNSNKKKSDKKDNETDKNETDKNETDKKKDKTNTTDNTERPNKRQKTDKKEEPQESDGSLISDEELDDLIEDSDDIDIELKDIELKDSENSDEHDLDEDFEDPKDIQRPNEANYDPETLRIIINAAYTCGILDSFQEDDDCCGTVPPPPEEIVEKKIFTIKDFRLNKDIKVCKNITDLINLLEHKNAKQNQIDLRNALIELNNLVGLSKLKDQIVNQILFFIQDLNEPGTFLHTVITGSPGTGKTTLINIMAKIYKSLGILKKGHVIKADRADLIAEYLGQTAVKTKKVLESAKGGILLIDEAYSLGSDSKNTDSFSKECIDTINQYLSEHVDELVCIICGYEKEIEKCFFKKNSGLARRFQWRFNIDSYSAKDLFEIFRSQLEPIEFKDSDKTHWVLDKELTQEYIINKIDTNMKYFSGNGGSTRSLIDKCKVVYAQRNFTNESIKKFKKSKIYERVLSVEDFDKGLEIYLESMNKNNKAQLCGHCTERDALVQEENNCSNCKIKKENINSMYS